MGERDFYTMQPEYKDLDPPICFYFIYTAFIDLYNASKEKITYLDIDAYCRVKQMQFSLYEIELIKRMETWASIKIDEMKEGAKG